MKLAKIKLDRRPCIVARFGSAADFAPQDLCVVLVDYGETLGTLCAEFESVDTDQPPYVIRRKATQADIAVYEANKEIAEKARIAFARNTANERMHIKILDARFSLDRSRLCIFFGAVEQVDLRRYMNQIQRDFNTRVELCQVGVRDEAMLTGGLGICGRTLCCTSLGVDGDPVNVRMAKTQDLVMNASAVNGMCGRLKCCLMYEYEQYAEAGKHLPAVGTPVSYEKHSRATVVARDILNGRLTLRLPDGTHKNCLSSEVSIAPKHAPNGG